MSIPVVGSLNVQVPSETKKYDLGITYLYDYELGDFVLRDGKLVELTDIEAVKAWVSKIIRTEKFSFEIYDETETDIEYGVTLEEYFIGKKYPTPFAISEAKRQITEAVLLHPRITALTEWKFSRGEDFLSIEFRIILNDGSSFTEGRVFNG